MEFQNLNPTPGLEASIIDLVGNKYYDDALVLMNNVLHEPTPQLIKFEALCYLRTDKAINGLEAIKKAEEKGWMLPDILSIKAQCLYKLHEWESALFTFEEAYSIKSTPELRQWILRCKAHIDVEDNPDLPNIFTFEPPVISDVTKGWYQTSTHICIQLLVKGVTNDDLVCKFLDTSVDVLIKQKKPEISVHINLPKEIIPEESTFIIHHSSIELKLRKKVPGIFWNSCEE